MTIDEAIEELEGIPTQKPQYLGEVSFAAIHLGIEAMKRIKHCRQCSPIPWGSILPGEITGEKGGTTNATS